MVLNNAAGGVLTVSADASAVGDTSANAAANITRAIWQNSRAANGVASTSLVNDGLISISGEATGGSAAATTADAAPALATGNSSVNVTMFSAILQDGGEDEGGAVERVASLPAGADGISHEFVNNDTTIVTGTATANATGTAGATAFIYGALVQNASAQNVALDVTNGAGAQFNVPVTATANGDTAIAYGFAQGVIQAADASSGLVADGDGLADVAFTNAGVFHLDVQSTATGVTSAGGSTQAYGVTQNVAGSNPAGVVTFDNTNDFSVSSLVSTDTSAANNTASSAQALAFGYMVTANNQTIEITNAGNFAVLADAAADNGVGAIAGGMLVTGADTDTVADTPVSIVNSGTLTVTAKALDRDATAAVLTNTSLALANGIAFAGTVNNATVTNTGTIVTTAIASPGGHTEAYGISFLYGTTPAAVDDLITINNNGGTITSRVSTDNGATYQWGTAIVTGASAPVAINLNGGANGTAGKIYGIIDTQDGDIITVGNGETQLNGAVNKVGELEGTLDIIKGGTLFLQDNPEGTFKDGSVTASNYNGPSKVYVDQFSVTDGGILAFEAPNYRDPFAYAEYPQVFANEANLAGGVIELRPSSATDNGLFDDTYELNDVIVASKITGTLVAPVKSHSVLLNASAHQDTLFGPDQLDSTLGEDAVDTIDIAITRVAFNKVAGMDRNETSVATAIEGTYDPDLSATNPAYAAVLADLFKIEDARVYANAMEQLAATQYAGYLRSSTMAGARFNGLIYDMAECGKGSITNELCRSENGGPRLWVTGNYGRVSTDGEHEAAGFKAKQYWIAAGLDFAVSPNFVLGVAGGYLENTNKFKANEYGDKFGDRVKASGWQAGIYGNYDSGKFYVKGAISYSDLDGDARRTVDLTGMGAKYVGAPLTTMHGLITSDPDVNVWAAGAEAGVRFPLGANAAITPYASLDYAHAKLKRFDEESGDASAQGVLLSVRGSDEFFASELGLELAAQWGNVAPYIRGGWQHNFGDKRAKFTGEFINAPAGTEFDVISERFSPDAGVVEVGLATQFSPNFNAHLGYQGRFSSNLTEHSGGLTLSYLFGGAEPAAPPPPPAPVAPPPPPAPPQVVCNKGPYIVFFDWDKSDITPEAATVLDSAVTAYGNCDVVPIMLAGYTDRSGSDRYNQGLSARRNTSVQGYLTGRGIPADRISAQAFGETNNRVPTADGVRELQNRRVEITYGPGSGN